LPVLAVNHGDEAGHPDKNRDEASSSHGTSSGIGNALWRFVS
jgi:hypothetical protein